MQSSSCQNLYFVWVFGFEDIELILQKLVLCLGFWIRGCRTHPANVGWCFVWVFGYEDADLYFVWIFGYEDVDLILPKLVLCLCFWI